MQKTVLSTADVARLFNVTETTVKRWADEGALKCQKTPGGHRKFVIKYVIEFAEKNNIEPLGALEMPMDEERSSRLQLAVLERDVHKLSSEFTDRLLSSDNEDLLHYLSYLYEHKIPLWQIYDDIVRLGLREIGSRWEEGTIGVEQEHRATYKTLDALARLQSQILVKDLNGRSALLACPGDELHELGLRCIGYLFEAEGWRVHYLGAQTPLSAVIRAVHELHPSAVCVSLTRTQQTGTQMESLKEVAGAAHDANAVAILGGRGALENADFHHWFDIVAATARELDHFLINGPAGRAAI